MTSRTDSPAAPPDPRPTLFAMPRARREPLRREWLARNMRFRQWWVGCCLLCTLPLAGAAMSNHVVFPRVTSPTQLTRTLIVGGGALAGCATGLLALRRLATPIALQHLRNVLAANPEKRE